MTRTWLRWLPGITVAALLALALVAPRRGLGARSTPEADYLYYPVCTSIQQGSTTNPYQVLVSEGTGVSQPIGEVGNFSTCSLTVQPAANASVRLDVVSWDPGGLLPDPTTVALRTVTYWATYYAYDRSRFDLFPPVITRTVPGLADPPVSQTAVEFRVLGGTSEFCAFNANVPSSAPGGLLIPASGPRQPLPGAHPVFAHSVCGGDGALQSLYLVQSVMGANALLDPSSVEFIQKFRVPVATSARWVELAFAPYNWQGPLDQGRVRIIDAQGQATPPLTFAAALADAAFYLVGTTPASWQSHYDFPIFPTLQPNHDYWLVVTTHQDYSLYSRMLTGGESPYFKNAIGRLYQRSADGADAALVPDRALSFRLIGQPVNSVGVAPLAPARGGLRLEVSPNPARGAAAVSWSGAGDGVRIEVLDARGRRVASGAGISGSAGRWTWSGAGDDGRALPAGVYFVHVRDAAGRSATTSVALVR